jgi:hypothetical protein
MFILYCIGAYINVNFEFKNKNNENIDYSEIKELKYYEPSTITIIVQIKDKNVFFIENVGTSLNAPMKSKLASKAVNTGTVKPLSLNESPPYVVNESGQGNEPSPPYVVNEPLNQAPVSLNETPNQGLNLNLPNETPNQGLNLNTSNNSSKSTSNSNSNNSNQSTASSSSEEQGTKMSGGKIKRGGNNIKLK